MTILIYIEISTSLLSQFYTNRKSDAPFKSNFRIEIKNTRHLNEQTLGELKRSLCFYFKADFPYESSLYAGFVRKQRQVCET